MSQMKVIGQEDLGKVLVLFKNSTASPHWALMLFLWFLFFKTFFINKLSFISIVRRGVGRNGRNGGGRIERRRKGVCLACITCIVVDFKSIGVSGF